MITVYHTRLDDMQGEVACGIAGGFNPDRAKLAALLMETGFYEAVAECDLLPAAAGLETVWTMTQNGVLSDSWSRKPPIGLRPLEPTVVVENGRAYGRRSSMVGDVFECAHPDGRTERHVCDVFGFMLIPQQLK